MDGPRKRSGPAPTGPPRTVPAPTSTTQTLARRPVGALCGCMLPPPWLPCPSPPPRPGEPFYMAWLAEGRAA
jgi:hypothetical protein